MGHDCLNPEVDFPEIVLNLLSVSFNMPMFKKKEAYQDYKNSLSMTLFKKK